MPTATISPASSPRWGSSSFNHTGGFKVGTTTDGVQYYGHIPFPALDPTWHITSIKLRLNRTDSYSSRTHRYGVNSSSAWGNRNSLHWSKTQQIASGTGYKIVDLSAGLATIKAYTGKWQVHVTHGAGSYSYMEFTNSPQLIVEYEIATIDVPALTCGEAATLSVMTPPVAGTYLLSYSIGSASGVIDSVPADDTTEVSWTPPLALAAKIVDATSAPIALTLTRDDEPILTVDAALAVPVSMVPSISDAVFSIVNPVDDAIGIYVQGRSATKATITAASVYGATIASYGMTIAGKTYTGGSKITSDVLALAGTLNAVITATDTRGRTASLTVTGAITVHPYAAPLITDIALARALVDGTESNDGTYIKATLACRLAALADLNTRELTLRFRPVDGDYGAAINVTLPAGYDFSVTAIIGGGTIGAGAYEVQATLADRYADIVEVAALSSAQRWLTFKANGDTQFHGDVRIEQDAHVDGELAFGTMPQLGYSTTEIDTGLRWVDDKPIYSRTITATVTAAGSAEPKHGIPDVDLIWLDASGTFFIGPTYVYANTYITTSGARAFYVAPTKDGTKIRIEYNFAGTYYIRLLYTKTTD